MRHKIVISSLLLSLLTFFSPARADARVEVGVSVSAFYDELSPYGEWVTVGSYGEVWRPRGIVAGWQPYWNGRWCYTEYGWTWVSFDPWGADPYHYGTWVVTADWGWVWIPGTIWAPAWVTWCDAGGYIGWAPVPPSFSIGLVGYSGPAVVAPVRSYVFVPTGSFVGASVQAVRVDPARNATFVSSSRKTTSFAVSGGVVRTGGPPVARIQKVTGTRVQTVNLGQAKTHPVPIATSAGEARHLSVIAPRREQTALKREIETRGAKPAPPALRAEPRQEKPPAVRKEPPHEMKAGPPARQAEPPKEEKKGQAIRKPEPQRETKAQPPARKAEPPHEAPAQLSARKPGPHEVKGNVPPRKPEPRPETKPEPSAKQKEPPHDANVQAAARRAERPHDVKAMPALQRAEPRHESKAQPAARRPEPPHEAKTPPVVRHKEPPHETTLQPAARKAEPPHQVKAQPVARKPEKPEKPDKKGG